jgi:hypothetical protein
MNTLTDIAVRGYETRPPYAGRFNRRAKLRCMMHASFVLGMALKSLETEVSSANDLIYDVINAWLPDKRNARDNTMYNDKGNDNNNDKNNDDDDDNSTYTTITITKTTTTTTKTKAQ